MDRKLCAVLAADVVGYSKMMSKAEYSTLAALKQHRRDVFAPLINSNGGRIVKFIGDGTLVEFVSAVSAVEAAIAIQLDIASRADDPIRLRIGINLGDVIIDDDDIYGDGVNIAARIEPMAETGGVCISGNVFEQIDGKIEAKFSDLGEHALKNIDRPIRLFGWTPNPNDILPINVKSAEARASIAVLPFDNMSGDLEQEYFADGVAEDIITELSRFGELLVIARNTTFTYKGRSVDVAEVSSKLGVRYVVEGSVRKAGNRVRVSAQLIDGSTGAHIWADRFDRELDDIFAVQDDITMAIVAAVAPGVIEADARIARSKRPEDLNTWEMVYQARWSASKGSRAGLFEAIDLLERAIEMDQTFARAYTDLGLYSIYASIFTWIDSSLSETTSHATELAGMALKHDANNAMAEALLGYALTFKREFDDAEKHLLKALEINPNLATGHAYLMLFYSFTGEFDKATEYYRQALRLSPYDLMRVRWSAGYAEGAFIAEKYEEALDIVNGGIQENSDHPLLYRSRAAIYSMLGQPEKANRDIAMVKRFMPDMTLQKCRESPPIKNPAAQERFIKALRQAGLPE